MRPMLAAAIFALGASSAHAAEQPILGDWRVQQVQIAPWTDEASAVRVDKPLGAAVRLSADAVSGPNPLSCANARWEATSMPAEGLFQGGLPAPAKTAALNLGLSAFPVSGASLSCDAGVFEFHFADASTVLLALDDRIWTLSRAPGALAREDSAEGFVQRFFEAHFDGEMSFDAKAAKAKKPFLSRSLAREVARYMNQPTSPDEAPVIDGDPFTDSQDYPTRFAVGRTEGGAVPVELADCCSSKRLVYRLVKARGAWKIDDIAYPDGSTLREVLRMEN